MLQTTLATNPLLEVDPWSKRHGHQKSVREVLVQFLLFPRRQASSAASSLPVIVVLECCELGEDGATPVASSLAWLLDLDHAALSGGNPSELFPGDSHFPGRAVPVHLIDAQDNLGCYR